MVPFLAAFIAPDFLLAYSGVNSLMSYFGLTDPSELLLHFTILLSIFAISAAVVRSYLLWQQAHLVQNIAIHISTGLYTGLVNQPYEFFLSKNSSDFISLISTKMQFVVNNAFMPFVSLFSGFVTLTFISTGILLLYPKIFVISSVVILLIYVLFWRSTKKIVSESSKLIRNSNDNIINVLKVSVDGIKDLLLNSKQVVYVNSFAKHETSLRIELAKVAFFSTYPRYLIEGLTILFISVVFYLVFSTDGEALLNFIPVAGALGLAIQKLLPIFQQFYAGLSKIKSSQTSLEDILLAAEQFDKTNNPSMKPSNNTLETLEFKSLGYAYPGNTKPQFRDLKLKFNSRTFIGLFGASGSGKTTLLDLICGLLVPTQGEIYVNGKRVNSYGISELRYSISYVSQDFYLIDDTVENNILFGNFEEPLNTKRLEKAIYASCLDNLLKDLPNGLKSGIGENGSKLSGGQRQRIGLARAVYKNSNLLILDEATSALDKQSEAEILTRIKEVMSEGIVVMVTHNPENLKVCDITYNLQNETLTALKN